MGRLLPDYAMIYEYARTHRVNIIALVVISSNLTTISRQFLVALVLCYSTSHIDIISNCIYYILNINLLLH
jgi:hypothetical protein